MLFDVPLSSIFPMSLTAFRKFSTAHNGHLTADFASGLASHVRTLLGVTFPWNATFVSILAACPWLRP